MMDQFSKWIEGNKDIANLVILPTLLAGVAISTYIWRAVAQITEVRAAEPLDEATLIVVLSFIVLALFGRLVWPVTWLLAAAASITGSLACFFWALVGPGFGFLVLCAVCLFIGEAVARARRYRP